MSEENSQEYSDKMIEAFVGKAEKTFWYKNAFSKYNINGIDAMQWNWSWWAFFTGWAFLLYRKQYAPAAILFIAQIVISSIIPFFGWLATSIATGGYAAYFVYKGYKIKLNELENTIQDENVRVETMRIVGGYNSWVVWLYVIFTILMIVMLISFLPFLALMA